MTASSISNVFSRLRPDMKIRCKDCLHEYIREFQPLCKACGGMTEAVYDLENVRFRDSENPYIRFQELLPVHDAGLLPQRAAFTEMVHARKLGAMLGMPNLYLKNESQHPTGTTKDHMAAVSLAYMHECGGGLSAPPPPETAPRPTRGPFQGSRA